MEQLKSILGWANTKDNIRVLILTGSLAGKGKKDVWSDYDLAVFGREFSFIENDHWLKEIGEYWVCIHDHFYFENYKIPTRLTIFNATLKVDFSFHPLELLQKMTVKLPDAYNIGYAVLLDKDGLTDRLPRPTYEGFLLQKPTPDDFEKNIREFFFEVYHVAKYLIRDDLWTAKLRDLAAKEWLRQMLEWQEASKRNWNFSPKNDEKGMKDWLDGTVWPELERCFGKFNRMDGKQSLENTIHLFKKTASETAQKLNFHYNRKLDENVLKFVEEIK